MAAQCKDGQVGGCFIPGMSVFLTLISALQKSREALFHNPNS